MKFLSLKETILKELERLHPAKEKPLMGMLTTSVETKIKIISLIGTSHELDGIKLRIVKQLCDGPCYIGEPTYKEIDLMIEDEEVVI